jgi:hypothetical protein
MTKRNKLQKHLRKAIKQAEKAWWMHLQVDTSPENLALAKQLRDVADLLVSASSDVHAPPVNTGGPGYEIITDPEVAKTKLAMLAAEHDGHNFLTMTEEEAEPYTKEASIWVTWHVRDSKPLVFPPKSVMLTENGGLVVECRELPENG